MPVCQQYCSKIIALRNASSTLAICSRSPKTANSVTGNGNNLSLETATIGPKIIGVFGVRGL